MDVNLFERLLHEEEGPALDFKEDQYPFARATDDQKSELLKDIIAFANAWRRTVAYVLIGVKEVRGGQSTVTGVSDQPDDHSLQQFVNHKVNRPIRFAYEAFTFDGKPVGIIKIEQQERPFYLKADYGKLKKKVVYVRRGSSTGEADLDEVAQMGRPVVSEQAELDVQFADLEVEQSIGKSIALQSEACQMPPRIPRLEPPSRTGWSLAAGIADRPNENFFREMAGYIVTRRIYCPIRIIVHSKGKVAADEVRIELSTPAVEGVGVLTEANLPQRPYRDHFRSLTGDISPRLFASKHPGEATVHQDRERFQVQVECGSLQPGRKVLSDVFYVARLEDGDIELTGCIFAANLANPIEFSLKASFTIKKTEMTIEELSGQPDAGEVDV